MPATMRDVPAAHLARPHRPVLVAGTLDELAGPTRGTVELPLRLWWNPDRAFDLSQPTMLAWMYENVLREAIRVDELRDFLDGPTLVRVWPGLNLPRAVRAAWEARHPRLRLAAKQAAAKQAAAKQAAAKQTAAKQTAAKQTAAKQTAAEQAATEQAAAINARQTATDQAAAVKARRAAAGAA